MTAGIGFASQSNRSGASPGRHAASAISAALRKIIVVFIE